MDKNTPRLAPPYRDEIVGNVKHPEVVEAAEGDLEKCFSHEVDELMQRNGGISLNIPFQSTIDNDEAREMRELEDRQPRLALAT